MNAPLTENASLRIWYIKQKSLQPTLQRYISEWHQAHSKSVMPTTRNHLTTLVTHLETELSKHVWELKNKERDFSIKWSILKRVSPRTAGRSECNLCLEEKLCILESDSALTLNKRSELFSKCRHRYMFSARNFKRSRNSKDR